MRFPHRDFKRDWNPGDSFCRCRSIKMGFYRHIGIDRVKFMLKKHVKRWVQFVGAVIYVTNTTDYTEHSASDFAPKWFSHFWMTARVLPKQAHPGRLRRPWRFAGTGGFAARGGGHITSNFGIIPICFFYVITKYTCLVVAWFWVLIIYIFCDDALKITLTSDGLYANCQLWF